MKTIINYWITFIITAAPLMLAAQDVIEAKEASKLARDKNVVLISARNASDYGKVHAINSINVDPAELADGDAILRPANVNAAFLGSRGISNDKHLIIYDDGSMKAAGRLYWIFKYMGVEKVSVVDGGMKAWRINRLPVTKNPTPLTKATFTAKVQNKYLADYDLVTKALGQSGYVILDVRTTAEFDGTAPGYDVPGHIPGAVNIDHTEVLTSTGTLRSSAELKALFERNGITRDKRIIVYCRTSVRAGIVFLSLHSALGYPNVMVYDGAYTEWQKRAPGMVESE